MADQKLLGHIAALYVYPIKGCAAIALDATELCATGIRHDRRWMIVDPATGRFLSQRTDPALATIRPRIGADALELELPDGTGLAIPLDDRGTARTVEVWGDRVEAVEPDAGVSAILGRWLGRQVALVRFPETALRLCDPTFAPAGSHTAFADGFPLLVTTSGSLDTLNDAIRRRGAAPVPMSRFRPNVVIGNTTAGAEDRAKRVVLADSLVFDLVKRCERCAVTTVDQATGTKAGKEPLATLAAIRADKTTGAVWFGQNAVPRLAHGETAALVLGQVCRFEA